MLQSMAALKLADGLCDEAYARESIRLMVEKTTVPEMRQRINEVYPLDFSDGLERWREISKEAAGYGHLTYPHEALTDVIDLNCVDHPKLHREAKELIYQLKDELSDVSVTIITFFT